MTPMPTLRTAAETPVSGRAAPPTWVVVALACAGQFLVVLDVSVVNTALPSMRADLGLSASGLQWVVNAYTIAFAGFMLLGGRAGDLYGRKRMFLIGLALFTLASLAGGLAQEGWQLLAARAAQGLGAAVLAPSTLTILTSAVPEGAARARAIATWTAVGGGGGAAGGLVGGVLVDGLSWRWVLLINVPIGAVVLAGALLRLAESRAGDGRRIDLPGALLVTAGLATLAYGIVQTEAEGWASAATLVPLAAGAALIGLFVLVEARTKVPLMPLKLFRLRSVSSANVAMFLCGSAMFCMWFFMTLYAQNVLGYSPLDAGLALVPSSLAVVLGSKAAPRLMRVVGARNVAVLGALVAAVGFGWQSTMTADGSYLTAIMFPGILMMLGAGLSATPLAALATSGAEAGEAGLVSGLINTSRTMGGAIGLSVMSTIAAARTGGGVSSPEALTEGYALVFRTGGGVLLVGVVLMVVWLPRGVVGRG
ncbi:DHA2 family efflux MFS transporter permease subunit [Streptomyces sp. NBC_00878]|uniref:DHA2 family efflux MFS transporter permease subunit n=1 Tax=Streptomyces sp. NBC_00878 TaxID=2975854 RepID=UPI00225643B4|nr:DHA2 family efflux MFS transporter permease subunit [Streptomyces sp. NBC_00878]MCX4909161.1 DHA2 family efflux MFS transporter permease subunit [Streptomyces sp. NBC_00878]